MSEKRSATTTGTLLRKLLKTNNLDQFMKRNRESFLKIELASYFDGLCVRQHMTKEAAFAKAEIDKSFGYQMLRGDRSISRDNVLRLAIALGLSPEQTDDFLKHTRKAPLYTRIDRDTVILFGLTHHWDFNKVQAELKRNNITVLGGSKHEI